MVESLKIFAKVRDYRAMSIGGGGGTGSAEGAAILTSGEEANEEGGEAASGEAANLAANPGAELGFGVATAAPCAAAFAACGFVFGFGFVELKKQNSCFSKKLQKRLNAFPISHLLSDPTTTKLQFLRFRCPGGSRDGIVEEAAGSTITR